MAFDSLIRKGDGSDVSTQIESGLTRETRQDLRLQRLSLVRWRVGELVP